MGHVLEVDNVVKQYGKSKKNSGAATLALAGASFFVDAGGIRRRHHGPFGSGKSTLLNCISTIDAPTSSIRVAGRDVTKMRGESSAKFRRDQLGFIFSRLESARYPHRAREYLTLRSRFKRNRRARYLSWSTKSRRGSALQRFWSNIPTNLGRLKTTRCSSARGHHEAKPHFGR